MGSDLYRVQVLLIGLILAAAGLSVVLIVAVVPPTPARQVTSSAQPLAAGDTTPAAEDAAQPRPTPGAAATPDESGVRAAIEVVASSAAPTAAPADAPIAHPTAAQAAVPTTLPTALPVPTAARAAAERDVPAAIVARSKMVGIASWAILVITGGIVLALGRRWAMYVCRRVRRSYPASAPPRGGLTGLHVSAHHARHWLGRTLAQMRRRTRPRRGPSLDLAPVAPFDLSAPERGAQPAQHGRAVIEAERRDGPQTAREVEHDHGAGSGSRSSAAADDAVPTDARWTAEDRVLAAGAALTTAWADLTLRSTLLALDTACHDGSGDVVASVDAHPADERALTALPARLRQIHPDWESRWQGSALAITVPTTGAAPVTGPLLIPVLQHGPKPQLTRYLPLATWRHLAIYGGDALDALHAVLGSLLYLHAPQQLALAVLDGSVSGRLYRDAPHRVATPGNARATLEAITSVVRLGKVPSDARPLVLVVVEPDGSILQALAALLRRLRHQPALPLHLLVVQTRLHAEGRELYAVLPALITAGGVGDATWLPGSSRWPTKESAWLVGRGMRLAGRVRRLDEAGITSLLRGMASQVDVLPPVLWDGLAGAWEAPTRVLAVATRAEDLERDAEASAPCLQAPAANVTPADQRAAHAAGAVRDTLPVSPAPAVVVLAARGGGDTVHARGGDRVEPSADDIAPRQPDPREAAIGIDARTREHMTHPESASGEDPVTGQGNHSLPDQHRRADTHAPAAGNEAQQTPGMTIADVPPPVPTPGVEAGNAHASSAATSVQHADAGSPRPDVLPPALPRQPVESPAAQRLRALLARTRPALAETAPASSVASAAEAAPPVTTLTSDGPLVVQPLPEQDDPLWPGIPGTLKGSALRVLFERIQADDVFKQGFTGVSFSRVSKVLPAEQRPLVRRLVVWFDHAGILEEPPTEQARYQSVRRLRSDDTAWLAAQLRATPVPTQAAADEAVAASQAEARP